MRTRGTGARRVVTLLVAATAAVGLFPATAGAATPPPSGGSTAPASSPTGWQVRVGPAAQTVQEGQPVVFSTSYSQRSGPVTIRWQTAQASSGSWTDLRGGGAVLKSTATRAMDGALFRAVVSTGQESASSPPAILHVRLALVHVAPATPSRSAASAIPTTPSRPAAPAIPTTPSRPAAPSTTPTTTSEPAAPATSSQPAAPCLTASCPSTPPPTTPSLLPAVPTAAAPTSDAVTSTATASYGTVASPVLELGQEQTATGHDFPPGILVDVTLEPSGIDIGTFRVAPDGTVTTRFATTGLMPGIHTVRWTPA